MSDRPDDTLQQLNCKIACEMANRDTPRTVRTRLDRIASRLKVLAGNGSEEDFSFWQDMGRQIYELAIFSPGLAEDIRSALCKIIPIFAKLERDERVMLERRDGNDPLPTVEGAFATF